MIVVGCGASAANGGAVSVIVSLYYDSCFAEEAECEVRVCFESGNSS